MSLLPYAQLSGDTVLAAPVSSVTFDLSTLQSSSGSVKAQGHLPLAQAHAICHCLTHQSCSCPCSMRFTFARVSPRRWLFFAHPRICNCSWSGRRVVDFVAVASVVAYPRSIPNSSKDDMCAWCRHTRGRFERAHGDVLSGHMGFFSLYTTRTHTPRPQTHNTTRNITRRQRQRETEQEDRQRERASKKTEREKRRRKRRRQERKREDEREAKFFLAKYGQVQMIFDFFQCILAGQKIFLKKILRIV